MNSLFSRICLIIISEKKFFYNLGVIHLLHIKAFESKMNCYFDKKRMDAYKIVFRLTVFSSGEIIAYDARFGCTTD